MKKHLSKKRVVLAAIVTVALAIASGVAYAYWTSTGSGTATAGVGAGTLDTLSVTQDSTPSGLYPGGSAQPISFSIKNTASYSQNVKSVTVEFDSPAVSGGDGPGCTASDFELTATPVTLNGIDGVTIATGVTTPFTSPGTTLPKIAMKETGSNQNDCKNATVNLVFTAS